jgi:hypothetical protein
MIVVGDFLFAGKKIREKQKGIVLWPWGLWTEWIRMVAEKLECCDCSGGHYEEGNGGGMWWKYDWGRSRVGWQLESMEVTKAAREEFLDFNLL